MKIEEGCKIKLKSGEIARVVEVLKRGEAYMVEVFLKTGGLSVNTIMPKEIASVFVETEIMMTA